MRGALAACIIWFFASGVSSACSNAITGSSIGGIRLGMTKSEILESGLPVTELVVEHLAIPYSEYRITICEGAEVVAHFNKDDYIDFIRTSSAYFKTAKGAHVGMTLKELRELYPEGEVSRGAGDSGLYVDFSTGHGNQGFAFDTDELDYGCVVNDIGCEIPLEELRSIRFSMV